MAIHVENRLTANLFTDVKDLSTLCPDIVEKASGMFLWARLVVDMLLDDLDGGRNLSYLRTRLDSLLPGLEHIFRKMLPTRTDHDEDHQFTIRFFQWVIFSARPLRLREWRVIFAMIQNEPPRLLREWETSEQWPADDSALEKRIQRVSKGLGEVSGSSDSADSADTDSVKAGAGSLDFDIGETRTVQLIHTSVHAFFLNSGFSLLDEEFDASRVSIAEGHLTIIKACINYLRIEELDDLVAARNALNDKSAQSLTSGESTPGRIGVDSQLR